MPHGEDREIPGDEPKKCPVCGETDPYPAWFCMMRATGNAKQSEPCSYSREGHERMGRRFASRQLKPDLRPERTDHG